MVSKEDDDELQEFIDFVRGGVCDEVKLQLEDKGLEILNTTFFHDLELDSIVELEEADESENDVEIPMIALSPLQVAIVSRQAEIIKVLLGFVTKIEEAEECIQALEQLLGRKVTIIFTAESSTYDKDDRSLDGMNAFHLAAKYYPDALEIIFDILRQDNATYTKILDLLQATDNHLQQTPLHVALRNSSHEAARYTINTEFKGPIIKVCLQIRNDIHYVNVKTLPIFQIYVLDY